MENNTKKEKSADTEVQEKPLFIDADMQKKKAIIQMLHDEKQELANDLIEWEDDGNGNYIAH